jgi:thiol-disulfide isomerase/thioredoxin
MSSKTLSDVKSKFTSCQEYIESMAPSYKGGWLRLAEDYNLDEEAVEKLKSYVDGYELVVLFAHWCGDARRAVPVLMLIEKELGFRINALGGMTKPPRGASVHWAVPPSPEEVETFGITSSPTIIVFKKSGEEIGRMKTRPKMTRKVETEILKIIEDSLDK